jgi:hypothetical protein
MLRALHPQQTETGWKLFHDPTLNCPKIPKNVHFNTDTLHRGRLDAGKPPRFAGLR